MTEIVAPFPVFSSGDRSNTRPIRALINLSSFKQNVALIKQQLGTSDIICVVKADAYGHGLIEISKAAGDHRLAVAVPEELNCIRAAGLKNQVWVLEGPFSLECFMGSTHTVWVIHSVWQLSLMRQALEQGVVTELLVCIKFDTGMHRLGFVESEIVQIVALLSDFPQITLYSTMTHFSESDQADQESVLQQTGMFDSLISLHHLTTTPQTLANSGAIMNYPMTHRDWVRPGIMLYSGESTADAYVALKPVMTFESAIISLRSIAKGDTVGYGNTWLAEKDSLIATVSVGYADGYPRHAPSGTPVAVIGKSTGTIHSATLAGRVSMDMITLDVSSIEGVEVGDRVELWGENISVGDVAELSGTISYELLTSVSKRVPRVYKN